jgi:hypothetical protein
MEGERGGERERDGEGERGRETLKGREHRAVDFKVVLVILNCDLAAIFALRHPRAPLASGRARPPRLA